MKASQWLHSLNCAAIFHKSDHIMTLFFSKKLLFRVFVFVQPLFCFIDLGMIKFPVAVNYPQCCSLPPLLVVAHVVTPVCVAQNHMKFRLCPLEITWINDVLTVWSLCFYPFSLQIFSGKTYTMVGTKNDPGLMVLSLHTIFHLIKQDSNSDEFEVNCSYLEVYNEVRRNFDQISWSLFPYTMLGVDMFG